jgi:hypothetical protein
MATARFMSPTFADVSQGRVMRLFHLTKSEAL